MSQFTVEVLLCCVMGLLAIPIACVGYFLWKSNIRFYIQKAKKARKKEEKRIRNLRLANSNTR